MQIFAGIVLYNPVIERLKESLDSIASQVGSVVLVDNGSKNIREVGDLLLSYDNTLLVKNTENQGIATALNQIFQTACEKGAKWALTLDQDTVCPTDIISKLTAYCDEDKIGIICPAANYEGLNINKKQDNKDTSVIGACMTSGSLTNVKAWEKVGGFREDYFIDFVDNEFCMKLHIGKYNVIRVNNCIMNHQLGIAREKWVLGIFKKKVCIHSPWRFYYMTRNNLIFIWEYKAHLNIIKEYLKLGSILWKGILYADQKEETYRYIKMGFSDAMHQRMGKLS